MKSVFSSIGKPVSKLQPTIEEESEAESDIYFVERIMDKKFIKNKPRYLVKWRGWEHKHNTWEPLENLTNVMEEIDKFEEGKKKKLVGVKRKATPAVRRKDSKYKKELIQLADSEDQETKVILKKAKQKGRPKKVKVPEEEIKGEIVEEEDTDEEGSYHPPEKEESSDESEVSDDEEEGADLQNLDDPRVTEKIAKIVNQKFMEMSLQEGGKKRQKKAHTKVELASTRKRDQKRVRITDVLRVNWTVDERQMKCYVRLANGKEEVRILEEVREQVPQQLIDYFIKQATKHKK